MTSDLALVVFDCDGVLVDSETISLELLASALTAAGLETSVCEARRDYQGLMSTEVVAKAEQRLGKRLPDKFMTRFEQKRALEFRRRLRPVPGAAWAVHEIKAAGIGVCVASQGPLAKTELTLGVTGLRALFDDGALFSAHSVRRGKPHPDLFLHAARTMGVAPSASLVVEDSPSGVSAGLSAHMRVVQYVNLGAAEPRSDKVLVIRSLYELPGLLGLR